MCIMNEIFYALVTFIQDNFFGKDWLVGYASIASIICFIITVCNLTLCKRKGRPSFLLLTKRLISEKFSGIEDLEIKYNDEKVTQLSSTILYLWNSGNEIIDINDIPSKNPFKISIKDDFKILSAKIIKTNKKSNNFSLSTENENEYLINFDFIGKNQGVAILILHTGESSGDIILSGETKQGAKFAHYVQPTVTPKEKDKFRDRSFPYILLGFAVLMMLSSLFYDEVNSIIPFETKNIERLLMIIMSVFLIIISSYLIKKDIPKNLEIN